MGELAFHTFIILFVAGLFGMFVGWFCRAGFNVISETKPAPQPATPPAARKTPVRKSPAKKKAAPKPRPKPKAKPKSGPKLRKKAKPAPKDDLKLISGVGPVLEKKLNRRGIRTFAHIAGWKKADIDKFDDMLNFKGRIAREGWVKQAKALAKKSS